MTKGKLASFHNLANLLISWYVDKLLVWQVGGRVTKRKEDKKENKERRKERKRGIKLLVLVRSFLYLKCRQALKLRGFLPISNFVLNSR